MSKNPMRAMSWATRSARRLSSAAAEAAAAAEVAPPESKPLYRRLSSLGANPGASVAGTMNEWLKEGNVVRENNLMRIIRELRRYKSYKTALELMEWMETKGIKMSFGNHAVRINLISKYSGVALAESYFSSLPKIAKNQLTYGALLNCYCQHIMPDKAFALHKQMAELNIASSGLNCNNLMTLYMKLGEPEKVQTLYENMKVDKISPDKFTCCILINSYASLNDYDSVEKVVQDMEEEVTKNSTVYTCLASHYNAAGLRKKAESALRKAEELMVKRNRDDFHSLIILYAEAGSVEDVLSNWKSLKAAFQNTTNMSYRCVLQAFCKLDEMDALKQCFTEWESSHIYYDMKLVNIVIAAFLKKDMIEEAESLREKAIEKGAGSDARTKELFSDYYTKSRNDACGPEVL